MPVGILLNFLIWVVIAFFSSETILITLYQYFSRYFNKEPGKTYQQFIHDYTDHNLRLLYLNILGYKLFPGDQYQKWLICLVSTTIQYRNPAVRYIINPRKAIVNKTIHLKSNVSPFGSTVTSFSLRCAHIVTTIPIGTLKKKFSRQSIIVRKPPSIGPTTKAAAITMLRIPMAFPSSFRLKASVTIMVPLATSIDPPTA